MKCILVADNADYTGGISSVLISQAQGMAKAGIQVSVFAAFGPASPHLSEHAENVVCLHEGKVPRNRMAEIWNRQAARRLENYLKSFDPRDTVIHLHSLSLGLSPSIGPVLRRSGIPYIVTAHDSGWTCPTGYSYNFQTRRFCTLLPFSAPCVICNCDKKTYAHKAFKLAKCGTMDYVSGVKDGAFCFLTPSARLHDRLRPRVPSHVPIHVLLNPVQTVDRGPRKTSGQDFLFVGRLWEEKGIIELLRAIGDDFPLTVIGDGELRADLQKQYPKVTFKGWVDSTKVSDEMRKARAVILPSIYLDTAPLVLTEALAQGVPVIASDRAGNSGLIENGKNGFVVDMDCAEDLRKGCEALMEDAAVRTMSNNAYRMYWDDPLTLGRHMASLLPILEQARLSKAA